MTLQIYYYPFGYEHYLEQIRKSKDGNATAIRTAEEQKLITGLKSVPKRERHRLREISTEDAFMDWVLRPQRELLEIAREEFENALERVEEVQEKYLDSDEFWSDDNNELKTNYDDLQKELISIDKNYQDKCICWYEAWLDIIDGKY